MSNFPNIIAAGMRDWSVKEWGAWYALTAGFITVTLAPFLWTLFSRLGDLRRKAESAEKSAGDAQRMADSAKGDADRATEHTGKLSDRVFELAKQTPPVSAAVIPVVVPAAPPNPPTPSATGISAAMRAQEPQVQRPNIPK